MSPSHPTALDLRGKLRELRHGQEGKGGVENFAKGGHLQEPLSSSVLSLEGTHHRGGRSKFKVCLLSESVFCFDE